MSAKGMLVGGFLEQITRCDLGDTGYFLNIQGGSPLNATCVNRTLHDTRQDCQMGNFWSFPWNASDGYAGKSVPPNATSSQAFDTWVYWDNHEKYKLFVSDDAKPIWMGKIWTSVPGYHLWHFEYANFVAGAPPLSAFAPPKGIGCRPELAAGDTTPRVNAAGLPLEGRRSVSAITSTAGAIAPFWAQSQPKAMYTSVGISAVASAAVDGANVRFAAATWLNAPFEAMAFTAASANGTAAWTFGPGGGAGPAFDGKVGIQFAVASARHIDADAGGAIATVVAASSGIYSKVKNHSCALFGLNSSGAAAWRFDVPGLCQVARHDSAEDFCRLKAPCCTAMDWIFHSCILLCDP